MNWNKLTELSQLEQIKEESSQNLVLVFKHSTTCPISKTALARLERQWQASQVGSLQAYYLDLLSNRPISNRIAEIFDVKHESPQILLIQNGICIYHTSHLDISFANLIENLAEVA